jgi:hypothetical protein
MRRKTSQRNRYFIATQKKPIEDSNVISESAKYVDSNTNLLIEPEYGQKEPRITIYSKTKTILCQIFCFWK